MSNTNTTTTNRPVVKPELIPDYVIEDLYDGFMDAMEEHYKDPENERRFQEWVVEYRKRRAEKAQKGGN